MLELDMANPKELQQATDAIREVRRLPAVQRHKELEDLFKAVKRLATRTSAFGQAQTITLVDRLRSFKTLRFGFCSSSLVMVSSHHKRTEALPAALLIA